MEDKHTGEKVQTQKEEVQTQQEEVQTQHDEPVPTDRFWTIPNVLCLARLCGGVAAMFLIIRGFLLAALIVYLVSEFTDMIDGTVARKLNQVSLIGANLDICADTGLIIFPFIGFAVAGLLPWYMVVLSVTAIGQFIAAGVLLARNQETFQWPHCLQSKIINGTVFVSYVFLIMRWPYCRWIWLVTLVLANIWLGPWHIRFALSKRAKKMDGAGYEQV